VGLSVLFVFVFPVGYPLSNPRILIRINIEHDLKKKTEKKKKKVLSFRRYRCVVALHWAWDDAVLPLFSLRWIENVKDISFPDAGEILSPLCQTAPLRTHIAICEKINVLPVLIAVITEYINTLQVFVSKILTKSIICCISI